VDEKNKISFLSLYRERVKIPERNDKNIYTLMSGKDRYQVKCRTGDKVRMCRFVYCVSVSSHWMIIARLFHSCIQILLYTPAKSWKQKKIVSVGRRKMMCYKRIRV
jgi:hypothetical protein